MMNLVQFTMLLLIPAIVAREECAAPVNVLWLPIGDSITWGCNGPSLGDCHNDSAGYRVPLALALTQHPLGPSNCMGFNVRTMGTLMTGPPYVPQDWLRHEGHPAYQINMIEDILGQSLRSSPQPPDLITIHIGTNDCNVNMSTADMEANMNSLLGEIKVRAPEAQVFLADLLSTGFKQQMEECIVAFNNLIPQIVGNWAAQGMAIHHVTVFDTMQPGCGADPNYPEHDFCGEDQMHPTSAGYPRMASAFALSILRNFNVA